MTPGNLDTPFGAAMAPEGARAIRRLALPADPVLNAPTAKTLAMHLHHGQTDLAGKPYWKHVVAVGDMVALLGGTSDEIIAGYFHDAVEDEKATLEDLRDLGATQTTLDIVRALTKIKGEPNETSLMRVLAHGRGSCLVKFADLLHNTREDRTRALLARPGVDPRRVYSRVKTYRHWLKAIEIELGLLPPEGGIERSIRELRAGDDVL